MGGDLPAARPRLLELILARWEHRVTGIVAGPGFGKTTLISAAAARAPTGSRDVVVGVHAGETAESLAMRVAQGVEFDENVAREGPTVEAIVDRVARHAPHRVAIVVDDAHLLDTSGIDVLVELARGLPTNGHLVVASRERLDGRLGAMAGAMIDESELAIRTGDLDGATGVERDVVHQFAGWPAMVDAALHLGWPDSPGAARDQLLDRLLDSLPSEQQQLLGLIATLGEQTDDTLVALGIPASSIAELAALPMCARGPHGTSVHELWHDACRAKVDRETADRYITRAVAFLIEHGPVDDGIRLAESTGDWELVLRVLGGALRDPNQMSAHIARDVLRRLPDSLRDRPAARLAHGLAALHDQPKHDSTVALLESAARGLADEGDTSGEVAALSALSWLSSQRPDVRRATRRLHDRLGMLAEQGDDHARRELALHRALVKGFNGDAAACVAELDALDQSALSLEWQMTAAYVQGIALIDLGEPDAAVERLLAVRTYADRRRVGARTAPTPGLIAAGRLGEADELLAVLSTGADELAGHRYDRSLGKAFVAAQLGDAVRARQHLAVATELRDIGPDGDAQFEATTAAVAIAAGDETSARRAALAAIEPGRRSLGGPAPGLSQLFPPAYVLDDDARAEYETAPLSGRWRDIRDAARALTSARAGRAVEWDSIDDVQIGPIVGALGLRWAAELACAAAASGRRTMADALFSGHGRRVRELVASLAESPTLGGAARQLLAELPTPPESPLEIRVLGPMELRIGSQTLHHADWRRERVRELLGLLVDRRRISRRAASATLWPDLDDRRAARNLAVTINYLNAVLEPHRPSGATAWFVRSDGPNVWLVDDDTVHIDAWEFERVLGERVDSAAAETTATVRALRMWGGDYLADLDRAEWAEAPRVRLRQRFVTAAVRVAELSAAIGQPADALEWAGKAIEADRWCEPAYVALATAQQQLGDRGGALRTLQRGEEALAELSLAPGAAAAELDRQLRAS